MKKITLSIFGLMLAFAGGAKEVSQNEASAVALRMMAEKDVVVNGVSAVTPVKYEGKTAYYAVSFAPEGWALISADDVATPLVGYSATGDYPVNNLPDNMNGWLQLNAKQILDCSELTDERHIDWDRTSVKRNAKGEVKQQAKISPLINVNWDQGNPYNKYCPSNESGRAVVGCVAVAMGQAMTVPQYPPRPQGSISFYSSSTYGNISIDFTKEPAYNWANIVSGANSKDDLARLLWHCGMSVKMQYSPGGSGAFTETVPAAMKTYFDYPSSVTHIARSKYEDKEWNSILLSELEAGRPVIYHGNPADGSGGHAFNLDGYDGAFYHVNWGWGGAGNGYFSLDRLASVVVPGGPEMEFTIGHGMVIGIRARTTAPTKISLSNTSVREKQAAGALVGAISVECDYTNVTYTYNVQGKKTMFGYAAAPFEVKNGNLVTTASINAADYEDIVTGKSLCNITITATNHLGESISRQFNIEIKASSGIEDVTLNEDAPVEYYNLQGVKVENPENGVFIKRQGNKATKVVL